MPLTQRPLGFTLTELAIVLVIVALLLGGLLVPLSAQYDNANLSAAQKELKDIQEALIGFAVSHGRLPCPADATVASGAPAAGLELAATAAGCPNVAGVVPWATLGVSETDPWGRRYTYRVTQEFARSTWTLPTSCNPPPTPPPSNAVFALCSLGDLTVIGTSAGNPISVNIPAIVISHGKNGNGAYLPQGTQLALGSDVDESQNQLKVGGTSTVTPPKFVSKLPTDTFDDVVVWLSPNILLNRMVAAGKLP